MAHNIKIILLDDHAIIRKGIRLALESALDLHDIAEVASNSALLQLLTHYRATHLITDLLVSDGITIQIIPNIRRLYPEVKILVFTGLPLEFYAEHLRRFGIEAVLSKNSSEEITLSTLRGFFTDSPSILTESLPASVNPFAGLSRSELDILTYLLKGTSTRQIGVIFGMDFNTVATIKARIFEKTHTDSLKQLIDLAFLFLT